MTTTEGSSRDPSQAAGNVTHGNESMLEIAGRVTPLFELELAEGQAQFADFVDLRIGELSPDKQRAVGLINQGGTDEFIAPYTDMVLMALTSLPYHMDDPEAYTTAFPHVRNLYNQLLGDGFAPERAYVNAAVYGTNYGQAKYFESVSGSPQKRLDIADEIISDDEAPEDLSIADFKSVAMCQERAAVVHNTLQILGVESRFATGVLERELEDGAIASEPHAFILVSGTNGKQYILDPTNPTLVWESEGQLSGIRPAFYEYQPDEAGRQTVELREFTMVDGRQQESRRQRLTYTVDALN